MTRLVLVFPVVCRDIKPENVLFTEHRVLKLADFGLAIDLTEERAVTRAGEAAGRLEGTWRRVTVDCVQVQTTRHHRVYVFEANVGQATSMATRSRTSLRHTHHPCHPYHPHTPTTCTGTLDYMAPEVLRCPPKNLPQENKNNPYLHYNNSVDAWAVGVFAYELVVGFPPFAGE